MTAPPAIPPPPPRIARLPQDRHGRPVPWFVAWIDDAPDFRIVAAGKVTAAIEGNKCFVCGEALGRWLTFAVGPMSVINRTAPEPPAHKDCARYAAQACPFLARPGMRRRVAGLPEGHSLSTHAPGVAVAHNPGVTALWTTRSHAPFSEEGGVLFRMGDPDEVLWFCAGRAATRDEAAAGLAAELAVLRTLVEADLGASADSVRVESELAALAAAHAAAQRLLP